MHEPAKRHGAPRRNQFRIFRNSRRPCHEPPRCLHGVGRNHSKKNKTRFIAVVLHPADAKDIVIPEKSGKKE
jgi:hypothetical protein